MTVFELNRDQLTELKQQYYINEVDENPDYYTLSQIDDYVTDDEVFDYYGETDFVPEDFDIDFTEAVTPLRVVIDVNARNMLTTAIEEVLDAVENGDTRGYLEDCQFEIQER